MPSVKYAFISAYLKGQEARLVTSAHIDSLQGADTVQDALATVRETDVGRYLEDLPVRSFDYLDESLWKYLAQSYAYIEWLRLTPRDVLKILRAYVVKYDLLNIKAALEGISTGTKAQMLPIGAIHANGYLDELSDAQDVDEIARVLVKCGLEDYVPALDQYNPDQPPKSKLLVQAGLQSRYYSNLLNTAGTVKDGPLLVQAFGMIIDLANLQIAWRAVISGLENHAAELAFAGGYQITDKSVRELLSLKMTEMPAHLRNTLYSTVAEEVLSNYERTGSITSVDEIIDKHKLGMLREILSPRVLSPLVLLWYLVLKEVEMRNLRLAVKGIVDGVPAQEVKDYLVL